MSSLVILSNAHSVSSGKWLTIASDASCKLVDTMQMWTLCISDGTCPVAVLRIWNQNLYIELCLPCRTGGLGEFRKMELEHVVGWPLDYPEGFALWTLPHEEPMESSYPVVTMQHLFIGQYPP